MRWLREQRQKFHIEGFTIGIPLTPISITIKRKPKEPPPPPSGISPLGAGLVGLAAGAILASGGAGSESDS
jgi:hypothetical protein